MNANRTLLNKLALVHKLKSSFFIRTYSSITDFTTPPPKSFILDRFISPNPNPQIIHTAAPVLVNRHYFHTPSSSLLTHPLSGFCGNVRFYAKPAQARKKRPKKQFPGQQKAEEVEPEGPRLNKQINVSFVRLVTDEGHDIVSIRDALERARKLDLDLVEVQKAKEPNPPVCKIMDYNKEMYNKQVKEKERIKSKPDGTLRQGDHKLVRFTEKIEQQDLKIKADTTIKMMERGYRVKCLAMATAKGKAKAKGKEGEEENLGEEEKLSKEEKLAKENLGRLLSRLTKLIGDVAVVESGPHVERSQAYVILRHVKFGPPKKSGVKRLNTVGSQLPTTTESLAGLSPEAEATAESNQIDPGNSFPTPNRYLKSEPRNQVPQSRPVNNTREPSRSDPQDPQWRTYPDQSLRQQQTQPLRIPTNQANTFRNNFDPRTRSEANPATNPNPSGVETNRYASQRTSTNQSGQGRWQSFNGERNQKN